MRFRLRFTKLGKIRFTSHRDVARMWERALRKAALPVAYTEGFSPRPKLSFGLALSTGHESLAEYLDVELRDEPDIARLPEQLAEQISAQLPDGLDVTAAAPLAPGTPSLQEDVTSCTWRIEIANDLDLPTTVQLVDAALAADQLVLTRTRKGKEVVDDLRPAVLAVAATGTGVLEAELAVHPRSVRPSELLSVLSPDLEERRVLRTAQWVWRDGVRLEPLPSPAPSGDLDVGLDTTAAPGTAALAAAGGRATA